MRLHRLEIRNFRKLRGPVVLDGLGGPLVVVAGDNEEGKSTVLHALKAALFEHHAVGGAVREEMAPYDGGVPEVALEFAVGGARYRLRKAFKRSGVALEEDAGGRWSDDAAEHKLQSLLRFDRRQGRSEPGPRFQGLLGLFWLDQGTSFALPGRDDPVAHARDRLAAAIGTEIGAAADGGLGAQLLERAREQCGRFWTEKRWSETGELERAAGEAAALGLAAEALRARLREAEDRIDRLARLRRERQRAFQEDELGRERAKQEALREQLAGVGKLEEQRERARERFLAADSAHGWAERRHAARLDRRRRLRELVERRRVLGLEAADAAGALEAAERGLLEAAAAETAAAAALAEAEAEARRSERELARGGRLRERARAAALLADAQEAERQIRRANEDLAANPATRERLMAVLDSHGEFQAVQAALDAVATQLEFRPRPGATVLREGAPVDTARPIRLLGQAEFELGGFGRLAVLPGGGDVAKRRGQAVAAEAALRQALAAAGGSDLERVRRRAEERSRTEAEAGAAAVRLAAILQASGSRTVDALAQALAAVDLELAREEGAPPPGGDPREPGDEGRLQALAAAARRGVDDRRRALEAAGPAAREAERRRGEARQRAAVAGEKLAGVADQVATAERELHADGLAEPDAVLVEALARTGEERGLAAAASEELERQIRLADPEGVRRQLDIAGRALREIEAEADRRERAISTLEIELRTLGDDGLGERLAEAESRSERATAHAGRVRLEANAWRLLHAELSAAEGARRRALVEPVLARVRPWLGRLFPGVEPVLDGQSYALVDVHRGGVAEPVHKLSVGTREQIAVLVRLGLAQLLREREGEAPCLVLDDALVYADEARFDAMKAILERAAREGQQILVLTCRPRDYRGLDARLIRLEDCRG